MRIAAIVILAAAAVAPAAETPHRTPQRDAWSWNRLHATVTATGDLAWAPEPFAPVAGTARRYIDFAEGDDDRDGEGPRSAWKHHPWDPQATGRAKGCHGVHTYVFKRGVAYRGALVAAESGTDAEPIRLTSDPSWGSGEAALYGSEPVTGWTRGAGRADIPDADHVWWVDLPFAPRCVWEEREDGLHRLALARTPNWSVTDPEDVMSGWWQWEQPEWWTGKNVTEVAGQQRILGVAAQHLRGGLGATAVGGVVWSEYGIVMGTPFPSRIEAYDAQRDGVAFAGVWYGGGSFITGNRYFLEDRPGYLDAPGEFWFDRIGDGGRLYLRLDGDRDPNRCRVEACRRCDLIDSRGMSHVEISGLAFRCTNVFWDYTARTFIDPEVDNAAIRLLGSGTGIRVANCAFQGVAKAIRMKAVGGTDVLDRIEIVDNDIADCDHGAIDIADGDAYGKVQPPTGRLADVRILRNRIRRIGFRPIRSEHGHALVVDFPETLECAGNLVERTSGSGIFVFGGRSGICAQEAPLTRILIHHNRAEDTLLSANDWGGIETWMCGPHYVYGNISGNANGYWNWQARKHERGTARLGFAYYFDGSNKNYVVGNVAWGRESDPASAHCSTAAFYQAGPTVENWFVDNTAYRFFTGSTWSPRNGRSLFLGNLFIDISSWCFAHGAVKEDNGPVVGEYPHHTIAYGRNVFHRVGDEFALCQAAGTKLSSPQAMGAILRADHALASDVGVVADADPVRDAAAHDFRPRAGSAAIDRGARVFVPWSLARPVGEWFFRRDDAEPTAIRDHHLFLAAYAVGDISALPRYDLTVAGAPAFAPGPLEDWTDAAALRFDGRTTVATVAHATIAKPFAYEYPLAADKKEPRTASGAELQSPDIHRSSLLIECYVRPTHGGGLVAKLGPQAGYRLALDAAGKPVFAVRADGRDVVVSGARGIADDRWHHVLAELDRAAGTATVYVDGLRAGSATAALGTEATLANEADLVVGRDGVAGFLTGAIEFVRICRSSLAESRTSIEELYDWEFDGPCLRDLAGKPIAGARRDAGAFESE